MIKARVLKNKQLNTENRKCGDCKNFKLDVGSNVIGICQKKLMTTISDMFVTYKNGNGTCFEIIIKS